jgi:hypothetical protein
MDCGKVGSRASDRNLQPAGPPAPKTSFIFIVLNGTAIDYVIDSTHATAEAVIARADELEVDGTFARVEAHELKGGRIGH